MTPRIQPRAVTCPTCRALPGRPCHDSQGHTLPIAHELRRQEAGALELFGDAVASFCPADCRAARPSMQKLARAFGSRLELR